MHTRNYREYNSDTTLFLQKTPTKRYHSVLNASYSLTQTPHWGLCDAI